MVLRDEDLLRSNRPLLRVADPLLRFAFAVIRPDRARFESRLTGDAWPDAQPRFRSQVLGPHFESMARDWVRACASSRTLGGRPKRVGFVKVDLGEGEKGYELDVVVEGAGDEVGGRTRVIAIGEAKASHAVRTRADLDRLERLRGQLAKRADASQAKILLFGRAGFDSDLGSVARARRDVELVDLARLYEGD